MKKIWFAALLVLCFAGSSFAAGDLTVTGNAIISTATITTATVTGSATIINGNLTLSDYNFIKFGQSGMFVKNNAYVVTSYACESTAYAEAKNVNGVIYTRAHSSLGYDSGWVVGLSASSSFNCGPPTVFYATASNLGVTLSFGSNSAFAAW